MADVSNISLFGTTYNIKDEIGRENCQNAINNLDNLSTKKFVFVGDSYAQGYTPDGNVNSWIDVFTSLAEITDFTEYTQGGTGFATSTSFTSLISSVAVDPDVDYVIVGGGYNDNGYSTVPDAIKLFYNTARIKFPNAIIYVGFFGWSLVNAEVQRNLITTCNHYKQGCEGALNLFYLGGVEDVVFNNQNYASDGYHPNQQGQTTIGNAVYMAFCRGYYDSGVIENYNIPNSNGSSSNASVQQLMTKLYHGIANIAWQHCYINFDAPQAFNGTGNDKITVTTIPRSCLLTAGTFGVQCVLPVIYHSTTGLFYAVPTIVFLDAGKLMFSPCAVTDEHGSYLTFQCDALQLPPLNFSFNIWGS